jgi:hypothetical protein
MKCLCKDFVKTAEAGFKKALCMLEVCMGWNFLSIHATGLDFDRDNLRHKRVYSHHWFIVADSQFLNFYQRDLPPEIATYLPLGRTSHA